MDALFLLAAKEEFPIKRLKYLLLQMENNTATYKEMYEGPMLLHYLNPNRPSETLHDPVYWSDDLAVEITCSNKLAQDKPTLCWSIPAALLGIDSYTPAAADFCLRALAPHLQALNDALFNRSRTDAENGRYLLPLPGGEVLLRNTACFAMRPQQDYQYGAGTSAWELPADQLRPPVMCLCIRMQVQLPRGKLRKTVQMLCRDLPDAVHRLIDTFDSAGLREALALEEKQTAIRAWLKTSDYCAFIANGSMLPRARDSDLPMTDAIPFRSTPEDEIEICGVRGMGIPKGVTVITGGGYSGKSTLLDALSAGIYNHAPRDGRELCITDDSAATISAEDGRAVSHVNIAPFIQWLPGGDTTDFSTTRASGSTSQAANIMEAVEYGAHLLLIDEDRSATNFMIRDRLMKELIQKEPIIPFTDRARELFRTQGVSTILVIGGSGEYLAVADRVYLMEDYRIRDVTQHARTLSASHGAPSASPPPADWTQRRTLLAEGFTPYPERSGSERLEVFDMGFLVIGDERIDVRGLHDLITPAQLDALGYMLRLLEITGQEARVDLKARIRALYDRIESEGLDTVYSAFFTKTRRFLDLPRPQELCAVIRRMRRTRYTLS